MKSHTRRIAAVAALAGAATMPTAASAHHLECRWGARVDVDPSRPDLLRHGVQVPTWGCSGPHVRGSVSAGGRTVLVEADRDGVRWTVGDSSAAAAPASPPPPAADEHVLRLRLSAAPRVARVGRVLRLHLRAVWVRGASEEPAAGLRLVTRGRSARTGVSGVATLRLRPRRAGTLRAFVQEEHARLATLRVRVLPRRR